MIQEININTPGDGAVVNFGYESGVSTISTTAGSTLSTFNASINVSASLNARERFIAGEGREEDREETLSNDSGVPNVSLGEDVLMQDEDEMDANVIVYV